MLYIMRLEFIIMLIDVWKEIIVKMSSGTPYEGTKRALEIPTTKQTIEY